MSRIAQITSTIKWSPIHKQRFIHNSFKTSNHFHYASMHLLLLTWWGSPIAISSIHFSSRVVLFIFAFYAINVDGSVTNGDQRWCHECAKWIIIILCIRLLRKKVKFWVKYWFCDNFLGGSEKKRKRRITEKSPYFSNSKPDMLPPPFRTVWNHMKYPNIQAWDPMSHRAFFSSLNHNQKSFTTLTGIVRITGCLAYELWAVSGDKKKSYRYQW